MSAQFRSYSAPLADGKPLILFVLLDRVSDLTLAAGLIFALETQFRASETAPGIGGLLLALWLAGGMSRQLLRRRFLMPQIFWELLRFWAIFAVALCLGFIAAILLADIHDPVWFRHDIFAYALLSCLTLTMLSSTESIRRLRSVEWMVATLGAFTLVLQWINSLGLIHVPGVSPWYWDRLRGWCDNPDQLALFCLLIVLMSLHLAEQAKRPASLILALICLGTALPIGWAAKSNAYSMALVMAFFLFCVIKFIRKIFPVGRSYRQGIVTLSAAMVILPIAIAAPIIGMHSWTDKGSVADGLLRNSKTADSDLDLRFYLWNEAVNRGVDSYLLGLGPGPHLEIPGIILDGRRDAQQPKNLEHPQPGLAPNFEAHNTFLELFVQGGALAVVNFISIGLIGLKRSLGARQDGLVILLFSLVFFGSFHVIFRHPIVWFVILLALAAQRDAKMPLAQKAVSRRRSNRFPIVTLPGVLAS